MVQKNTLLDLRDRKILQQLDRNARQSDADIAKKVGISKQVAHYRIQKLQENGIISHFYTIVNTGVLGLNSHYVFLQLERINQQQEKELLQKIHALEYVGWLVSGTGRWDAVVLVYADSIGTFDRLLQEILTVCRNHLHEYTFTTLVSAEHLGYKFLSLSESGDVSVIKQTEKKEMAILDQDDKAILSALSQDARLPITEISRKARLPLHRVHYALKKMIKSKIIEGFKPKISISKLGLQWYLLLLRFESPSEQRKKDFMGFCKQYKKVYYLTHTVGAYNLMLDVHVKSIEEFKEVLLELKSRFSDIIRVYESLVIFEEHKIDYFPIRFSANLRIQLEGE